MSGTNVNDYTHTCYIPPIDWVEEHWKRVFQEETGSLQGLSLFREQMNVVSQGFANATIINKQLLGNYTKNLQKLFPESLHKFIEQQIFDLANSNFPVKIDSANTAGTKKGSGKLKYRELILANRFKAEARIEARWTEENTRHMKKAWYSLVAVSKDYRQPRLKELENVYQSLAMEFPSAAALVKLAIDDLNDL